jgi:hypothetical protein
MFKIILTHENEEIKQQLTDDLDSRSDLSVLKESFLLSLIKEEVIREDDDDNDEDSIMFTIEADFDYPNCLNLEEFDDVIEFLEIEEKSDIPIEVLCELFDDTHHISVPSLIGVYSSKREAVDELYCTEELPDRFQGFLDYNHMYDELLHDYNEVYHQGNYYLFHA